MLKLKLLVILLALLIGQQVWSIPLIRQFENEEEITEVNNNSLTEPKLLKDIIDLSFFGTALFGVPDYHNTAQLVANYTPDTFSVNPEELGTYLEGDILVPKRTLNIKNGITSQSSRWSNAIVPYEISGNFSAHDISTIEHVIDEYHRHTCIRFVPRSSEEDYISIVNGKSGCWSSIGRIGGKQEVNFQSPGCLIKPGTAIHEFMHALGFLHEQNREERDSYVSIKYQNIKPNAVSNFDKALKTLSFGIPYDYGSVMHYSATAFSVNGQPTIIPIQDVGNAKMGQRDGFSEFDIEKLNKMYDCPSTPATTLTPGTQGVDNNFINSFVSGFLTGLGLGEKTSL